MSALPVFMSLSTCQALHFYFFFFSVRSLLLLCFAQKNKAAVIGAGGTVMEQAVARRGVEAPEMFANADKGAFPLLTRFMVAEVYFSCS